MSLRGRRPAALVTGASSGIGRAIVLRLAASGWTVFAGVRKEEDAAYLRKRSRAFLHPVFLDITDENALKACVAQLREAGVDTLDGLVNNAGITVQGPLEYLPADELRRQFEVNLVGQLTCTQTFLPLLRRATGRIVFIGSIAGRTASLPLLGPYCASKWALEALADTFRIELRQSGIKVALVEPGTIKTPIWDKAEGAFDAIREQLPPEGLERYDLMMKSGDDLAQLAKKVGVSPDRVARKVEHALTSAHPKTRYPVGDARPRMLLESPLPTKVRDWFISRVAVRGG